MLQLILFALYFLKVLLCYPSLMPMKTNLFQIRSCISLCQTTLSIFTAGKPVYRTAVSDGARASAGHLRDNSVHGV